MLQFSAVATPGSGCLTHYLPSKSLWKSMSLKLNVTSEGILGSPAPDEPGICFKSMCHVPSSAPGKIEVKIYNSVIWHGAWCVNLSTN